MGGEVNYIAKKYSHLGLRELKQKINATERELKSLKRALVSLKYRKKYRRNVCTEKTLV